MDELDVKDLVGLDGSTRPIVSDLGLLQCKILQPRSSGRIRSGLT